tara:strand:- start:1596 stop:2204 length:609 start_codon:yes stop_codon:yes gene_type:complete
MPNWTYNTAVITGAETDVKALINKIESDYFTEDEGQFTLVELTNCMPMPSVFEGLTQGARTIDGVRYNVWYEDPDGPRPLMDIVKEDIIKEHGTYEPVDWQYRNWGTKWGDCDTKILDTEYKNDRGKLTIKFDSAWGEPFLLLNHIAREYDLHITNSWTIELDNGSGMSDYPWSDEDTKEAIESTAAMHDTIKGAINGDITE